MATIKEINHDSSTTIGDHYNSVSDPDGAISVIGGAALGGSTFGVQMDFDAGTSNVLLDETFTASGNEYRWRGRLDFDGASNASSSLNVMDIILAASGGSNHIFLDFEGDGGTGWILKANYRDDASGLTQIGSNITIPSGAFCLDVKAVRETADGNNDGIVEIFLNGVSQGSVSNAQNFNSFIIERTFIDFKTPVAYTGTMKYDEWILDGDANAALGCGFSGYDLILGGGQP